MKNFILTFIAIAISGVLILSCTTEDELIPESTSTIENSAISLRSDCPIDVTFPCFSEFQGEGCAISLDNQVVFDYFQNLYRSLDSECQLISISIDVQGPTLVAIPPAGNPTGNPVGIPGVTFTNNGNPVDDSFGWAKGVIVPCGGSVRLVVSIETTCEGGTLPCNLFNLICPKECCPPGPPSPPSPPDCPYCQIQHDTHGHDWYDAIIVGEIAILNCDFDIIADVTDNVVARLDNPCTYDQALACAERIGVNNNIPLTSAAEISLADAELELATELRSTPGCEESAVCLVNTDGVISVKVKYNSCTCPILRIKTDEYEWDWNASTPCEGIGAENTVHNNNNTAANCGICD